MTEKKTKLNLFDFTMIVVSLVIGMGIFRTPANVAHAVPSPFMFFFVWLAGGLVALCGALTYAEIGSRLPVTGAYYKIFSYCYHPSVAFAVNCIILVSNAASLAGVALIGAEYITKVIMPDAQNVQTIQIIIAILSILVFYGVNLLGLRMSAKTQSVLTIIKISMILLLIFPLFFVSGGQDLAPEIIQSDTTISAYLKAFGIGLVAVSFTYGGYQQTINFGGDVSRPNRNIPLGIFIGIFVIIALYLTINYAYVKVIGFNELKNAKGIAAIMASHVFGDAAGRILSVLLFLSVLAYVNVLLMSNPRVMYAMSEDRVLPRAFGEKNPRTNVLTTSLSVFAVICVLIVFFAKEFDEILSFTIFLDCIGMAFSAATIFILRKRTPVQEGDPEIYKMKLYPLLPLIFISAYIFVAISIAIDSPNTALTATGVLAVFLVIYFVTTYLTKKKLQ
ncbi:APC family permease [Segetibacter sp. 3557_3]|uniref:APC family permease n=1 Tax=Segetibacter sp. 3557_3 TaxID=2547429 RepID=UPI0010592114|nr:APC family permease [Segetibacter sp. 3557_3]TDH19801.1 APC family permease [Segetibacter sp. 3557_3]